MVEKHLPPVVCFVEEVQVIQHGGIIEHPLDDVMSSNPGDLRVDREYFTL